METAIQVNANPGDRTNDIRAVTSAIMDILSTDRDREILVKALGVLQEATRISNTIQNCHFDIKN